MHASVMQVTVKVKLISTMAVYAVNKQYYLRMGDIDDFVYDNCKVDILQLSRLLVPLYLYLLPQTDYKLI